jgi:hypothetical protein
LQMHYFFAVTINELMEMLQFHASIGMFESSVDSVDAFSNFRIASMFWKCALNSLNSNYLFVFSRAFLALFLKARSDRTRSILARVVHGHREACRVITYRNRLHLRYEWWQDVGKQVYGWQPTTFYGSVCHVTFLAALCGAGALEALTHALNSAESSSTRACIAIAISALVSTAKYCHAADSGLVATAACARDALRSALLRTAIYNVSKKDEQFEWQQLRFANGKPCDDEKLTHFQLIREHEMIARALHDVGSSSTAAVHAVHCDVMWEVATRKLFPEYDEKYCHYVFYGKRTFDDGSKYEGQWVRTGDDVPPYPTVDELKHESERKRDECSWDTGNYRINGKMHGRGMMMYCNGDCYEGEWVDGRKGGKGVYKWKNGDFFAGKWMEGMPEIVITTEYLHRNKRAALIQKVTRRHLSRLQFQKLRANILFHGHLILNGCDRMPGDPFTKYQNPFFARPLATFIAQIGGALRQQLAPARLRFRPDASLPRLHATIVAVRGCLSAVDQSVLCRNRCHEVVFIARRLLLDILRSIPKLYISGYCLLHLSRVIVARAFRGYCRRVSRIDLMVGRAEYPTQREACGSMIECD